MPWVVTKVVETMKNNTSWKMMSINGVTSTTGSSRPCWAPKFTLPPRARFARARPRWRPRELVEQGEREVLQGQGVLVHPRQDPAVPDERGDADAQARHGGDEGLGDAARQAADDADPLLLDDLEGEDHAPHGAQEPQQGRDAGHRPQHAAVALELLGGLPAPRLFEALLDHGPRLPRTASATSATREAAVSFFRHRVWASPKRRCRTARRARRRRTSGRPDRAATRRPARGRPRDPRGSEAQWGPSPVHRRRGFDHRRLPGFRQQRAAGPGGRASTTGLRGGRWAARHADRGFGLSPARCPPTDPKRYRFFDSVPEVASRFWTPDRHMGRRGHHTRTHRTKIVIVVARLSRKQPH